MEEKTTRQHWFLVRREEDLLIEAWVSVSGEKWRTEDYKVSIMLDSALSSSIPVLSNKPRTFKKYNQSCIARQRSATRNFHRIHWSLRKRKRIEVNSEMWFDSRSSHSLNRQTSCVLHYCESDRIIKIAQRENSMRLLTSQNRAMQE